MKPTKKTKPQDPPFAIVMMRVDDLLKGKADYNPRRISESRAAALRESLARFGLVENLVWNKRTGRLVGGHQRADALAAAGLKEAPVRVVDLDDVDERALNIALNGSTGDWDWSKLRPMLDDLAARNADALKVTGFTDEEIGRLRTDGHLLGARIDACRKELRGMAATPAGAPGSGESIQSLDDCPPLHPAIRSRARAATSGSSATTGSSAATRRSSTTSRP